MSEPRLHDIYRQPAQGDQGETMPYLSFYGLAILNAGVVLDPLTTPLGSPIDKIYADGLPELPKSLVKKIITGHSEGRDETRALMDRYRDICQQANQPDVEEIDARSVSTPVKIKTDKKERKVKTIEEHIQEIVFADPENPDISGLKSILVKRPTDPDVVITIEDIFLKRDFLKDTKDLEATTDISDRLTEFLSTEYDKNFFKRDVYSGSCEKLEATIGKWICSLQNPGGEFSLDFRVSMIQRMMKEHGKRVRSAKESINLMAVMIGSLAEVFESPNTDLTYVKSLVNRVKTGSHLAADNTKRGVVMELLQKGDVGKETTKVVERKYPSLDPYSIRKTAELFAGLD